MKSLIIILSLFSINSLFAQANFESMADSLSRYQFATNSEAQEHYADYKIIKIQDFSKVSLSRSKSMFSQARIIDCFDIKIHSASNKSNFYVYKCGAKELSLKLTEYLSKVFRAAKVQNRDVLIKTNFTTDIFNRASWFNSSPAVILLDDHSDELENYLREYLFIQ